MSKHFFTFGTGHRHEIGDLVLDHNCVLQLDATDADNARSILRKLIGNKWAFQYTEATLQLSYYPRGIVTLP